MSFLSDVMGAGASFAMGNPVGAAEDLMQGIQGLFGGGNSQQQVGQQLAQLDQALNLPPGTLENIINANNSSQSSDPMGLGGGPNMSQAMQAGMNEMQQGMNEMQQGMNAMGMNPQQGMNQTQGAGYPPLPTSQQNPVAAAQMQQGMSDMQQGMSAMRSLAGQTGPTAAHARQQAMNKFQHGRQEMQAGMQAAHQPGANQSGSLNPATAERLKKTIEEALEKKMQSSQISGGDNYNVGVG